MKTNKIKNKYKTNSLLRWVGIWATVWWALSGIFLALAVVQFIVVYAQYQADNVTNPSWGYTIAHTFENHVYIDQLLFILLIGWILCGTVWFKALRSAKVGYKAGLKDLFFTIR